jgi:predicted RNA-binding protein with TRAM domain
MSYINRGNYGRSGGYDKPAPVEVGKEYEADITELSRRGDGIAKIQGFVVFVPNTKPGNHVKFKITRVARRFATAEVIE